MTTYTLAYVKSGAEFDTADAINELGAFAVVPRRVQITHAAAPKPERIDYLPLLPRLVFVASTAAQWHHITSKRLRCPQGILPPVKRAFGIPPRSWQGFRDFAALADQECEYRIGMHEAGKKVRNMRKGDIIRMIGGSIGDVELAGRMAEVIGVKGGRVIVRTDITLMGKPVIVHFAPQDIAAE